MISQSNNSMGLGSIMILLTISPGDEIFIGTGFQCCWLSCRTIQKPLQISEKQDCNSRLY